jgi:type II secretory pathway pseudopilin PulG
MTKNIGAIRAAASTATVAAKAICVTGAMNAPAWPRNGPAAAAVINMEYLFKSNHKGFSLLEVTAVFAIITFGLLGISSLVNQNIRAQSVNKNYAMASMLAQEGIELVRNKRDNNFLQGWDWRRGETSVDPDSDIVTDDSTYTVDYTGNIDPAADSLNDSEALLQIDGNGYYNHGSGADSRFRRLITVDDSAADFLKVNCTVRWRERSGYKQYAVDTVLYDWR